MALEWDVKACVHRRSSFILIWGCCSYANANAKRWQEIIPTADVSQGIIILEYVIHWPGVWHFHTVAKRWHFHTVANQCMTRNNPNRIRDPLEVRAHLPASVQRQLVLRMLCRRSQLAWQWHRGNEKVQTPIQTQGQLSHSPEPLPTVRSKCRRNGVREKKSSSEGM